MISMPGFRGWYRICSILISSRGRPISSKTSSVSCIKSKMGTFNGWLNGDFAKCLAGNQNNLWVATTITLKNTFFGFVTGVASGFVVGLILGRSDRLSAIFQPFITAVNSIPRNRAGADHRACVWHRRHVEDRYLLDRYRFPRFF